MHVIEAHTGATNDKFVIRGDEFHTRIMHTELYKDYNFDLFTSKEGAETTRFKGRYVLCDGGYGDWRNLVSAFSCVELFSPRANWSHRVARFRVLTSRMYRRKAADVENLFKVCCCLHNMIMRARDVRPGTGNVNLQITLDECNLDDGDDLQDVNARGQAVTNLRSTSIVDVDDDDDNDDVVLRVDSRDESDSEGAEELQHKTALQNALMRHWRIYAELHREEYDGYHPFVYSGSRLARERLDAMNGGR
jgi:hypothetical protein